MVYTIATLFNNKKTMKKTILLTFIAFAGLVATPDRAHACIKALGFLDPLCVISGDANIPLPGFNTGSDQTTNNYTNSNNITNSNVNSNVNTNTNGGTPVYVYDNYNYNNSPLGVSCYSTPTSAGIGDSVIWRASPYGGNGNYYISWSGTNGLSGNGTSISKRYNSEGTKNASVTVTSGNRTVSQNCGNSVEIYDYDNNNYNDYYDYDYDSNLSVSCSADVTFAPVGTRVVWRAYVSGGNGSYRYDWDGDENLNGSSKSEAIEYDSTGVKRASVEVRSGNRRINRSCSNTVTVGVSNNYNYNTQYNTNFQIACYPDKTSARIGTPVTWAVEAVGGSGNYSYSWIGTNGLSGNSLSVMTTYGSAGTKSATVTVTDSNGRTASQACGSTVYVQGATQTTGTTVKPAADDDSNNPYSAAALFSLKNIPWGWVIVLVFLVLFGTIVYLIATRNRIK